MQQGWLRIIIRQTLQKLCLAVTVLLLAASTSLPVNAQTLMPYVPATQPRLPINGDMPYPSTRSPIDVTNTSTNQASDGNRAGLRTRPGQTPPPIAPLPTEVMPDYRDRPTQSVMTPDMFRSQPIQPSSAAATTPLPPSKASSTREKPGGVVVDVHPAPAIQPADTSEVEVYIADAPGKKAMPANTDASSEGTSVTLYDATQNGTAPTFHADEMEEVAPVVAPASSELSIESKAILSALPGDLFPNERLPEGGFGMDRSQPTQELPSGNDIDPTNSIGANVAVKRQNIDVNYELEKAYNALLNGNTEVAVMIYRDILTAQPNNKHALFGLATTYHKLGMTAEARPVYGRLLSLDPYNPEALNNFLALIGEEAPDSAIAYLQQLKAKNPDFSPIPAQLAQLYHKQGKMRLAIANMQQAVGLSPENLIYRYNLAILYDENSQYDRAIPIYKQLIRAGLDGKDIPASLQDIQERLTFLASNRAG